MKFIKKCLGCVFYDNTCNEECIKCFKKNYKNFEPDLEPLAEDDFEIVGTFAGEGKYEGMLGGFILRNHKTEVFINPFESENFEIGTINSRCGSGFTDEQRASLGDELIGKIASIKYQGLTDDKSSLRFPIFLGIKEDR